ncbi:hypothetical protein J3B02_004504, partial [Coemansia erecta]
MGACSETSTQTTPDHGDYGRHSDDSLGDSGSPQLGDTVKLVFLIQSGDRAEREFKPSETILQVKQSLLESWPENFAGQPSATSDLRILYRGHFLDDKATLADSKLLPTSTVVHLTIRPSNKQEKAGTFYLPVILQTISVAFANACPSYAQEPLMPLS